MTEDFQMDEREDSRLLTVDVAELNAKEIVNGLLEEGGFNAQEVKNAIEELEREEEDENEGRRHFPRGYKGGSE
ncbi:hypothetical protein GL213_09950 [Halogeometricum borinquense]|uniref:Uncharacterized protein n=1 Tax=Halogeometricum borinquense (strain ATCC 700274 / DSM 11551 / JCM 10706 / KCTC 4070 / PR3) TaxID=469382 RepID=E4NNV5_HALBP|nr:hypothetical protein [Halogeometricum borinquense]ADQ67569.1 hypothetical protein Hbor_20030 [Halogeometricum borinquense DSM 11551]ELY23751.1 hypothetical protein C499_18409 [Halogeometricum borinquense DSM 11551]QIQ76807.1 hypothetical protein GL213_09950 [Halogeometricum borinquense]